MNPVYLERYYPEKYGDVLFKIYTDREYRQFFRRMPAGWSKKDILNIEELTASQLYAVLDKATNQFYGFCLAGSFCNYGLTAQVGAVLLKEFQNKKYGFWAIIALAKMMFEDSVIRKMKFKFLAFRKDIENSLIAGGLEKEGFWKGEVNFDGEFVDELEYTLTKETYLLKYKQL